jgi:hypothetical protein
VYERPFAQSKRFAKKNCGGSPHDAVSRGKESFYMCDNCQQVQEQLAKAHDDLLGVSETMNAQGKELAKLRRELNLEQAAGPTAMQVQRALEFWCDGRKGGKPNISPHGARARLVRQALKLGHTNPPLPCPVHDEHGKRRKGVPRDAECSVIDEVIEAFTGLKLVPFVGPNGGRVAEGVKGATRYDDVTYALTVKQGNTRVVSETAIENMRGYVRRARMWPSEKLWAAYQATSAVSEEWCRLAVDALNWERMQAAAVGADVIDLASRRSAA